MVWKREPWLPRMLASKDYERAVLFIKDRERFTLQTICDEFGFSSRKTLNIMAAMLKNLEIVKVEDRLTMSASVWKYWGEPTVPKIPKRKPVKTSPPVCSEPGVLEKIEDFKKRGMKTIFVIDERVIAFDEEIKGGAIIVNFSFGAKIIDLSSSSEYQSTILMINAESGVNTSLKIQITEKWARNPVIDPSTLKQPSPTFGSVHYLG